MLGENDPEGVAFEYEVLGDEAPPSFLIDRATKSRCINGSSTRKTPKAGIRR
jgi:hypothetical protein